MANLTTDEIFEGIDALLGLASLAAELADDFDESRIDEAELASRWEKMYTEGTASTENFMEALAKLKAKDSA
jgi:hypothetical protein